MILIPPVETMILEVEKYVNTHTWRKIKIVFNDPFKVQLHIEMLRDAYKFIKKDEAK